MAKVTKKKTLEYIPTEEESKEIQKEIGVKKDEKVFNTYTLMFTIEGHRTWRISMFQKKGDLEVYLEKQPKHPKILEKRWFVCNRITGSITEEK